LPFLQQILATKSLPATYFALAAAFMLLLFLAERLRLRWFHGRRAGRFIA
jgi:hypothetical protein